jgi:transcriptional regulator with XRE-family HTH domain
LTLRKLASLLGVSAPFLSDVEHGRRRLSRASEVERLLKLKAGHFAEAAGVCPHCMGSGIVGKLP